MGWTYCKKWTKESLVDELVKDGDWTNEDGVRIIRKTLDSAVKREGGYSVLWTLNSTTRIQPDGATSETVWIGCALLQADGAGWGYKDMDESMGPYYVSCPMSFLKRSPVANAGWRADVAAYNATRGAL